MTRTDNELICRIVFLHGYDRLNVQYWTTVREKAGDEQQKIFGKKMVYFIVLCLFFAGKEQMTAAQKTEDISMNTLGQEEFITNWRSSEQSQTYRINGNGYPIQVCAISQQMCMDFTSKTVT